MIWWTIPRVLLRSSFPGGERDYIFVCDRERKILELHGKKFLLSINSYEQKSGQWYRLIERELDYILK